MLRKILDIASSVLVIVVAVVLLWRVFNPPTRPGQKPPVVDASGTIAAEYLTNTKGESSIALIEFTDFECAFCARHALETLPVLEGVRYISLPYPSPAHALALPSAIAAECAGRQGKYWEMHHTLFTRQRELDRLVTFAPTLGLDETEFNTCMADTTTAALVERQAAEGVRLRVEGTPTVFLGTMREDGGIDLVRRFNGAQPATTFAKEIAKITKG
jgi:protein-disulfide isomerase